MKKITEYFVGVKKELGKVKWTTKKDMLKYTFATITFVLFFSVFFYGIDLIMAWIRSR